MPYALSPVYATLLLLRLLRLRRQWRLSHLFIYGDQMATLFADVATII